MRLLNSPRTWAGDPFMFTFFWIMVGFIRLNKRHPSNIISIVIITFCWLIALLLSYKQHPLWSKSWETKTSQLFKMAELRKFQTEHKQAIFRFTFSDTNNFLCFVFLFLFLFIYFLLVISHTIRLTFCYSGGSTEHKKQSPLKAHWFMSRLLSRCDAIIFPLSSFPKSKVQV